VLRCYKQGKFVGICDKYPYVEIAQNKVYRTIGNFPRHTPAQELHKTFNIPYIYDYITKLCRKQAEVIQNHENANVRIIGQGGRPNTESIRGLNLAAVKRMTVQVFRLLFQCKLQML
jgi:hypothetical protein